MVLDMLLDPAFLNSVPRFLTPILLAALGGAICERAGVFNIALEGFILVGAFCAVLGSYFLGSEWWGALAAIAGGVVMGLLFAEFSLRRKGDGIVVSIGLNLFAAGLTVYLLRAIFDVSGAFRDPGIRGFAPIHIPGLSQVPVLGPFFSGQSILFYIAVAAALALHVFFARHRLGLRIRAAGENPAGLVAGGVNPNRVRLWALVMCGALCGLAGAQLSIANVNLFVENMSAGRGWIAVVAVLLTRGHPVAVLLIALLFGFVDSFSFRVQGLGLPQQFSDMMPYLATLIVLLALSAWRKAKVA
ncbi:MAG: sugar ABC transporter permease [Pelagibacterium sp. SCN 64-44]|nr:MAG: sugar ABC transporter permease [Pelagibacterium sp. SCN 64-44]